VYSLLSVNQIVSVFSPAIKVFFACKNNHGASIHVFLIAKVYWTIP